MTSAVKNESLARVRALLAKGDERTRLRAILRVQKCDSRTFLPLLVERLESESTPALLAGILGALAELATGAQVPVISLYLSHPDHRVVKQAVRALDRAGSEDALPLLMSLLNRSDAGIAERALSALERANHEHLVEVLRAMSRNSRPAVRERVLAYLKLVRAPEVEDLLVEMVDGEPSDHDDATLAVLAGRATARSAAALRGLSARRPDLAPRLAQILGLVAARSPLSLELFDLAPDADPALAPPPRPTASAAHRVIDLGPSRRRSGWRWAVPAALAALCLMFGPGLNRSTPLTGSGLDPVAREMMRAEPREAATGVAVDCGPAPGWVARIEATAARCMPRSATLTREQVTRAARARLCQQGWRSEAYIELKARAAWRTEVDAALKAARASRHARDTAGAIRLLRLALEALDRENLLLRRELSAELAVALLAAGRVDEAREVALAGLALTDRITRVLAATVQPWSGRPLSSDAALESARLLHSSTEAAFKVLAARPRGPDGTVALTEAERRAVANVMGRMDGEGGSVR